MNLKKSVAAVAVGAALAVGVSAPVALAVPSQADLAAAETRISELGEELSGFEAELADKGDALEQTHYSMEQKQIEIDATKEELVVARTILKDRMRSGYKTGIVSIVDVLLNSTSFDDLISRIHYMDKINQSDAEAIDTVKTLEANLEEQQSELKEQEETLEAQIAETTSKVEEYQEKVAEAQAYYNSLDAQIQEELARQAAEEAARRAEEEAARQAAEAAAQQQQQAEAQTQQTSAVEAVINTVAPAETTTTPEQTETTSDTTETTTEPTKSKTTTSTSSNTYGGGGLGSAYSCIGSPYVYGAAGPSSFDCSGLVCYCYGYGRGRTTYAMIDSLKASGNWKTSMSELSAGDLVFTHPGHVGIYIGGGQMIHAPSPGRAVQVAPVYAWYGGGTF